MHTANTVNTPDGVLRIEVDYDGDFRLLKRWFFLDDKPVSEDGVSLLAGRWLAGQAND